MVLANIEWVASFCTALIILCTTQVVLGTVLSVVLPDFLTFTGIIYTTGATLIAGFVALPTTIRLKTSQMCAFLKHIAH